MYDSTVPVLARYLAQVSRMLQLAQAHTDGHPLDHSQLLQARLAPDMLPLAVQVTIATNFVFRICAPLCGQSTPPPAEAGSSFADLQARLATTQAYLASLSPQQMQGSAQRMCTSHAGQALVSLPAPTFVSQYALPNFFFHTSMVYAILRHAGVPLGKADFDGWHVYGAGQIGP
jgi:hypothetical protein